jgi:8-oxo-dGTP pyrophosphatase MutT (NUDIX family)
VKRPLAELLATYHPREPAEIADADRVRRLLSAVDDPWQRSIPLHVTSSALIVHPDSGRVLLRWHQRQQAWLQVGGHADPGEADPLAIALRESREETGLTDLVPWPDASLVHVSIVSVVPYRDDPAHEHADLRFVLATANPDSARPETPAAELRWLPVSDAVEGTDNASLRESLVRVARLLQA